MLKHSVFYNEFQSDTQSIQMEAGEVDYSADTFLYDSVEVLIHFILFNHEELRTEIHSAS